MNFKEIAFIGIVAVGAVMFMAWLSTWFRTFVITGSSPAAVNTAS